MAIGVIGVMFGLDDTLLAGEYDSGLGYQLGRGHHY